MPEPASLARSLRNLWYRLGAKLGLFFAGVFLTLVVTALYAANPGWLQFQDLKLYDVLLRHERTTVKSGLPVIVDIDEKSLAEYGQWPWPRYRIALLLGLIRNAGAKAAGLDIVFAEPDRTSPHILTGQLRKDLKLEVGMTGLPEALADYDKVLSDMLRSGSFALGYYLEFGGAAAAPEGGKPACPLPASGIAVKSAAGDMPLADCLPTATGVVCPLPVLAQATPAAGFFNAYPDQDGILRRTPLVYSYGGDIRPSLGLATVKAAFKIKSAALQLCPGGIESLRLSGDEFGTRVIPLDANGRVYLNYRGPHGAYPHVSAADILAGRAAKSDLAGKIVFVGTSAAGLRDLRASPLDSEMPGVEVHATLADMIVSGDFISRPDWAFGAEIIGLLFVGLLSAALMTMARAVVLLLPFLGLGAGVWYGSAALLGHQGLYVSPLGPLMILSANFAGLTFLKFWREERQKRFIHGAFAHYLSPKVVAQIVASPGELTLSGEERDITIMFSDIRGFTSISECLNPSQVVDLLHQYLTPMTKVITEHMGTLDKFLGDAIMAFWNAPVTVPRHRTEAIRSALAMQQELARLNVHFKQAFGLTIKAGIGIHSGHVRVGNFGSEDLFCYTVIGDAVNLASRLEGLTKIYGVPLLVTESLKDEASGELHFQEIDRVLVKGKKQPVTIYAVIPPEEQDARKAELAAHGAALALYRARDFAGAAKAYRSLAEAHGLKHYELFAERAAALADNPPPDDWNGVFEHTTK